MRRAAAASEVEAAVRRADVWPVEVGVPDDWMTLAELLESGVAGRMAQRMGRRTGAVPLRVGESALVMGLASRLWSLTVVPWARDGVVADPAAIRAVDDHGALSVGISPAAGWAGLLPAELHELVTGTLQPVVDALSLPSRVSWGNIASSLLAVPRVNGLPAARPVVLDLLARAPYAGELDDDGRRRTCCLFYLAPGAGLCGDCVLERVPRGLESPGTR